MEQGNSGKVIAGPAGHWYALLVDPQFGETLMGLPIGSYGSGLHERGNLPPHPADDLEGWYEITDPAPETDVDALKAELREPDPDADSQEEIDATRDEMEKKYADAS